MVENTFLSYESIIKAGQVVVAYYHPTQANFIKINESSECRNKYGVFKHKDMIGKRYGSRLASSTGKGFVYLLHPTPELWTNHLNHRTQILYQADISLIVSFLGLKPGVQMIETGTGSGSFSHSIARTLYPTGHLYTFEYHSERAQKAKMEFEEHGLDKIITIECRNVCQDGFGIKEKVTADLPSPWEAIPHTVTCFDPNRVGRICCYSPCMEQVQQTVKALNEQGFIDIEMYETLQKHHDVIKIYNEKWTAPIQFEMSGVKYKRNKRQKKEEVSDEEDAVESEKEQDPVAEDVEDQEDMKTKDVSDVVKSQLDRTLVSRANAVVRGHTSYLTFAKYLPRQI